MPGKLLQDFGEKLLWHIQGIRHFFNAHFARSLCVSSKVEYGPDGILTGF
jgi:hypothetical protein